MIDWKKLQPLKVSEEEIIANKKAGKIYVADFENEEGKYISTVFDEETEPYDVGIKISPRIELRITYILKKDKISGVQISKLIDGNLKKINLSTLGFKELLGLLKIFSEMDLESVANQSMILDSSILSDKKGLKRHLKTIMADESGFEVIKEIARTRGVIAGDIANIAAKKKAVKMFKKLLGDDTFFEKKKAEWGQAKDEGVWQHFFEKNKWIFGYGLEYVFNSPIKKDKLEQTLRGSSFLQRGKRPDGILQTLGLVNYLNIVEIKTHKTSLLQKSKYRGTWPPSEEIVGAITQCQQYIRASVNNLEEFFKLKDKEGNRMNKEVFRFQPKCFLVIGNMKETFLDDNGKVLNPEKLACFEYFRKNVGVPEVITFDQLYSRARNIISQV